jgi:hypothetical protein
MSQRDFNQLLATLDALSPEQMATLRRELDSKMASAMPDDYHHRLSNSCDFRRCSDSL